MWTDKYIGQPYVPSVHDCMDLARLVAKQELKLDLDWPMATPRSAPEQRRRLLQYRETLAKKVEAPREFHPVLLLYGRAIYHCGVVAFSGNDVWILHNDEGVGMVVCQRLSTLLHWTYRLEGYYEWLMK